ncbi:MAG: SET domain-containing protein [Bacteroidetes bacterium]|nr:SET domain-containing protein [Bacteroidota bacterium]
MKQKSSNISKLLITSLIISSLLFIFRNKIFKPKKKKDNAKNVDSKSPSNLVGDRNKKYVTLDEIKYLFKKLNVEYSTKTKFHPEVKAFAKTKKTDFLDYKNKKEYYDKITKKYDRFVKAEYVAPVYLKWASDKIGYGCFANTDIPAGNLISEYVGELVPRDKIANKTWSWKHPSKSSFISKFPKNISINGFKYGNETRFINHGVSSTLDLPNCKTEFAYADGTWRMLYIAKRYIKKDEEILVDYGAKYWNKRKLIKH